MREMKSGTFDPEAQWKAKWEKLHAEHPEYSSEAYDFVQKSMFHDHLKRNVQLQEGSRNISALIESCHAYAKELYGESARARLKSWGIDSFLDVGEIIILIGSGGARGMLNPDLERRLEEIHEKMRANLRRKYGQLPFLPEEAT
jgi:uncharacterized repeat protein (TIGR04138 family)